MRILVLCISVVIAVIAAVVTTFFCFGYYEAIPSERPLRQLLGESTLAAAKETDRRRQRAEKQLRLFAESCHRLIGGLVEDPPQDSDPNYELLLELMWLCQSVMSSISEGCDESMAKAIKRNKADYDLVLTFDPNRDAHALRMSLMANWLRRMRLEKAKKDKVL